MRDDIVPGAIFPDYELSDHLGTHRTLSTLQGGDPLVLVQSPLSAVLLGIALLALIAPFVLRGLGRFKAQED